MSLAPCSVAERHADDSETFARRLLQRIDDLERSLAETDRRLRHAEAEVALLNDRLAWAEADLVAVVEPPRRPSPPRSDR